MKEFIEKLIGRLEENTIYDKNAIAFMNKYGRCIGFISKNKAISIVNQLAEECKNDVCEWKVVPYYRIPNCGTRYIVAECLAKNFKFCPYCGKKIKVVE